MTSLLGAGLPALRQRKVTACARVQSSSGEKCVASVPLVMPLLSAVDRLFIIAALRNIDEGAEPHKADRDGMRPIDVFKRIRLTAPTLTPSTATSSDGVAAVGREGEGLTCALPDGNFTGRGRQAADSGRGRDGAIDLSPVAGSVCVCFMRRSRSALLLAVLMRRRRLRDCPLAEGVRLPATSTLPQSE